MNVMKPYMLLSALALTLSACSGSEGEPGNGQANQPDKMAEKEELKPVTLKLYHRGSYFSDEDFKDLIADPVKKKYPHLTVERTLIKDLKEVIAAGEKFDFYVTWDGDLPMLRDMDLTKDLTEMVKKHNFSLDRLDMGALTAIRNVSESGELYALPYAQNINALYYNKSIFDTFGVSYPKDGMTWEEAADLARKLTRNENGVQYMGLGISQFRLASPLSISEVNPKTNKAAVNSDLYKRVFEIGKTIYSIPGNEYVGKNFDTEFMQKKTLAMYGNINLLMSLTKIPDLNWNVAQFPSYKEKPNTYGAYDLHIMVPTKTSKHTEDQMRVLEVFFSDEVQQRMVSKWAKVSTMKDPKYNAMYAKEIEQLKNINISSIFKSKPAAHPGHAKYSAGPHLGKAFELVVTGQADINSALREAEEKINQHIDSIK